MDDYNRAFKRCYRKGYSNQADTFVIGERELTQKDFILKSKERKEKFSIINDDCIENKFSMKPISIEDIINSACPSELYSCGEPNRDNEFKSKLNELAKELEKSNGQKIYKSI